MTIVETRVVTGGVDTHLDSHVAAALDNIGGLLGVESFPTTPAGYEQLSDWLLLLVNDLDVRVITEDGELLRHLTLDPNKVYQPTGRPKGPTRS